MAFFRFLVITDILKKIDNFEDEAAMSKSAHIYQIHLFIV